MKPVDQIIHNPPEQIGTCFRACIASVLEIDVDDIPHLEKMMYYKKAGYWKGKFYKWAYDLGYGVCEWELNFIHSFDDYPDAIAIPSDEILIASGRSPRHDSANHSVVWKDGEILHDPHPSRDGLASDPFIFTYIFPLSQKSS